MTAVATLVVLCLGVVLFFIFASDCHGLAAINRQKRQQRGVRLAQQNPPPTTAATPAGVVVVVGGADDVEYAQDALFQREQLWGLAGKTSRRKRQRGKPPLKDLLDDPLANTAYYTDPSTVLSEATQTQTQREQDEDPSTLVQPEDIERVQVLVLPDTHTILADVTFTNGTTVRVDPPTLHQRRDNAVWMALRKAAEVNVTASELSAVANHSFFTTRDKVAQVKAGLLETTFSGNMKACEWGLKMEPKALRQYVLATGNAVNETGLHIRRIIEGEGGGDGGDDDDDDTRRSNVNKVLLIGASPDGLVVEKTKDGSTRRGLLEIKCLWGRRHKKELPQFDHCPKRFYDQIQGQLAVCDLQWCDLILYIPPQQRKKRRGGNGKNYCILRVQRDREYWTGTLLPAVQSFCEEVEQLRIHGLPPVLEVEVEDPPDVRVENEEVEKIAKDETPISDVACDE
jgi:hypothetical protein